jgi:hypothetical protein
MNYLISQEQLNALSNLVVEIQGRYAIPMTDIIRQVMQKPEQVVESTPAPAKRGRPRLKGLPTAAKTEAQA